MGPGKHFDCFAELAVTGDRSMVVGVGAGKIGEHLGVTRIGLRPRRRVPFPIPRRRHRVHGEHRVPGRHQCPDEQPTVGLGGDHHVSRLVAVGGDQLVEPGHTLNAVGQSAASQAGRPAVVLDVHVVMILGPIQTDEHLPHLHLLVVVADVEPEATSSSLMVQCSKHVIPPAITANLTDRPAHDLDLGLNAQLGKVLTGRRLGTILPATSEPMVDPH